MEASKETKNQLKNASKDKHTQRRSLNHPQSKNKLPRDSSKRAHASEIMQHSTEVIGSTGKSEAISSLEKHRQKSSGKTSLGKISSLKHTNESKQSKSKTKNREISVIEEGAKWVETHEKDVEIVNNLTDSIQNQNIANKSANPKSRNNSKSDQKRKTDQQEKLEKSKPKKSAKKDQTITKSAAKSKKGKKLETSEKSGSPLKRTSMKANELVNQETKDVEEVKSRKKSTLKSKKKE